MNPIESTRPNVQRSRVSGDQRRVLVRLAQKGDQLISEMAPLIELQYHYIEQAFGKQVFDDLFNALEGFIAAESNAVQHVELPLTAAVAAGRRMAAKPAGKNLDPDGRLASKEAGEK